MSLHSLLKKEAFGRTEQDGGFPHKYFAEKMTLWQNEREPYCFTSLLLSIFPAEIWLVGRRALQLTKLM